MIWALRHACFHISLSVFQDLLQRPGFGQLTPSGILDLVSEMPWLINSPNYLDDKPRQSYSCCLLQPFVYHSIDSKPFNVLIEFALNFDCGFYVFVFILSMLLMF